MNRYLLRAITTFAVVLVMGNSFAPAFAADVRSKSRTSISSNKNVNVNRNVNKNVNVRSNKNVNVNVDVDHRGGYYGGCCYREPHPIATIATVAVTAAIVGSIVSSLPSGCQTVIVNGFAYQQCGSTWYQPQISGSTTTYIVVNSPR